MITRILDGQTVTIEIDGKTVGTVRPRHVPSNGGGEWMAKLVTGRGGTFLTRGDAEDWVIESAKVAS